MKQTLLVLAALAVGLLIGYLDFRASEVQLAVLMILAATFALGAWQPEHAWRWALAIGAGVPMVHFISGWMGVNPNYPVSPKISLLLPFIPAFIGTYVGVAIRKALTLAHQ